MYDRLASVDVTTLQERVYQSLRLAILKGQFQPGDPISIRKAADALGTSPMPVREALKRLIAERALVQTSDRLIRVAPYARNLHDECIRIRLQLEGYAAERAALLHDGSVPAKLKEHQALMVEAATKGEFEAFLSANHAFHFEIYRAAGYTQLVDILESLWLRTGPVLATVRQNPDTANTFFTNGERCHARAIDAMVRRDGKAARRAISLDIRSATMWLHTYYDPQANVARGENELHLMAPL